MEVNREPANALVALAKDSSLNPLHDDVVIFVNFFFSPSLLMITWQVFLRFGWQQKTITSSALIRPHDKNYHSLDKPHNIHSIVLLQRTRYYHGEPPIRAWKSNLLFSKSTCYSKDNGKVFRRTSMSLHPTQFFLLVVPSTSSMLLP
jgi:hypothetical protein